MVFVVLCVAFLSTSVVLYVNMTDAQKKESEAKADLNAFITASERDRDETATLRNAAGGDSLFAYLTKQNSDFGSLAIGDAGADPTKIRAALGLGENETVKDAMRKLAQERDSRSQEAAGLKTRSADLTKEIEALNARIAAAEKAREEAVAQVSASIKTYSEAADGYRKQFEEAKASLDQVRADNESQYTSAIAALQSEADALRAERQRLDQRVSALQRKVEATSLKASNPAAAVDARVVDVDPRTNTLFIDIGANKRVVPGMSFEVFDDAPSIAAAAESGMRGKASVQVIKVGDTTSTCRIVRGSAARPVVKDNVLANAVFNPNYRYKFLVHGKFDVNGDGKPTTAEADSVRARVREWGGEVVEGDALTGDLDFLVLGSQPAEPAPLPSDATETQTMAYTDARNARELYMSLFQAAADAEIPVLNWTRFESLTGTVNR
ncbi:MAG: hypothetical protein ACKOYN_06135 [Planctomycetota bacterium]